MVWTYCHNMITFESSSRTSASSSFTTVRYIWPCFPQQSVSALTFIMDNLLAPPGKDAPSGQEDTHEYAKMILSTVAASNSSEPTKEKLVDQIKLSFINALSKITASSRLSAFFITLLQLYNFLFQRIVTSHSSRYGRVASKTRQDPSNSVPDEHHPGLQRTVQPPSHARHLPDKQQYKLAISALHC